MSYTIDDPQARVDGKTIAQWTQDWWTWAIQSPDHQNAIDDQTGQYAGVNNAGPVFFLGGTFGGDAMRTFTVPAGKPLLLPMLNNFDTEKVPNAPSVEKASIQAWLANVNSVFATIDGNPVTDPTRYIETTGFFSMGIVHPNTVGTEIGGLVREPLAPTLATGYYLMIEGLSPGKHTLDFGGSNNGFQTHVVDQITVV